MRDVAREVTDRIVRDSVPKKATQNVARDRSAKDPGGHVATVVKLRPRTGERVGVHVPIRQGMKCRHPEHTEVERRAEMKMGLREAFVGKKTSDDRRHRIDAARHVRTDAPPGEQQILRYRKTQPPPRLARLNVRRCRPTPTQLLSGVGQRRNRFVAVNDQVTAGQVTEIVTEIRLIQPAGTKPQPVSQHDEFIDRVTGETGKDRVLRRSPELRNLVVFSDARVQLDDGEAKRGGRGEREHRQLGASVVGGDRRLTVSRHGVSRGFPIYSPSSAGLITSMSESFNLSTPPSA